MHLIVVYCHYTKTINGSTAGRYCLLKKYQIYLGLTSEPMRRALCAFSGKTLEDVERARQTLQDARHTQKTLRENTLTSRSSGKKAKKNKSDFIVVRTLIRRLSVCVVCVSKEVTENTL